MTKSKDAKRRKAELLGMPVGTAERKLRKTLIHELARQSGKNFCYWCRLEISDPDELAITHVEDWEESPDLYFDLGNVALSHAACAAERGGRRQGEEEEMRVEVSVEDAHGNRLPGARHQDELYVAGERNGRYQVRVRNCTGRRVLVVTTVDGRNVNTGDAGDVNDSGHVLGPYDSWVYRGWRTSDDDVAAFRFGSKGESYSSQMGSPQNVGVIGVAVFEEREPDRPTIIREREYVPYPVPVEPWRPFVPRPHPHPWPFITWSDNTRGIAPCSSTFSIDNTLADGHENVSSSVFSCSVGDSTPTASGGKITLGELSVGEPSSASSRRSRSRSKGRQELGTEFGESLASSVVGTNFIRATDSPCEVHTIRYDSAKALRRRGIDMGRPSQRHGRAPKAFPESPGTERGYCEPPPRHKAHRR